MRFEYFGETRSSLNAILRDTIEFQDQIKQACAQDDVTDIAIHPLNPGLSGAAVFLVRRTGGRGRLTPWVLKACNDPTLIIEERENNTRYVQGILSAAPVLIPTGSSRILIFRFGAHLAEYNPRTLRSGYASSSPAALATLMHRIVTSLTAIHHFTDDVASCMDRMPSTLQLKEQLQAVRSFLTAEVAERLCELWSQAHANKELFSHRRGTAHGDLNTGNVLFEPGDAASLPVFIDFASMRQSKDSAAYPEFYHLPFWDYVKLERDFQTRLFLKEACDAKLDKTTIVDTIRAIDGCGGNVLPCESEPVTKLVQTTLALRKAIQGVHTPTDFQGCYRIVLARAMLSVLFRKHPDSDVSQELQCLIAAEAAIALLTDPTELLIVKVAPIATKPHQALSVPMSGSPQLTADERELVAHIYRFQGRCRIGAAKGEYECLWCPGTMCDMQWGWERTVEEAQESGKTVGDRVERLRWIMVVRDLVKKGLLQELPKKNGQRNTLYELTEEGWRAGQTMATQPKNEGGQS